MTSLLGPHCASSGGTYGNRLSLRMQEWFAQADRVGFPKTNRTLKPHGSQFQEAPGRSK